MAPTAKYVFAGVVIAETLILLLYYASGFLTQYISTYGLPYTLGRILGHTLLSTLLGLLICFICNRITKRKLEGWKLMAFGFIGFIIMVIL